MAVREPHRARSADGRVLGRRDLVRQPPTPEVGRTPDPRIGREHGLAVVHDDRGVADGLEAELHRQHSRVCRNPPSGHGSYLRMTCNVRCAAGTKSRRDVPIDDPTRSCAAAPNPEESRELLVPLVRAGSEPHLGRRPLRAPLADARADPLPVGRRRPPLRRRGGLPLPPGQLPGDGRVGIELEWILATRDAPSPSPAAVAALLSSPLPGGSRVTFEPGGQLELSGPAAADLGAACRAMRADTAAVRDALSPLTARPASAPASTPAATSPGCSTRRATARWRRTSTPQWPAGRTMMRNTASIQVNVDVGSPATVDARWHLAHDIGPVLTACFANSPFDASGRPSGYRSTRAAVWHAIDPARTDSARRDPGGVRRDRVGRATCSTRRDDDPHRRRPQRRPARSRCRSRGGSTTATSSGGRPSTTSRTT